MIIDPGDGNRFSQLVFEQAYQSPSTVPTDTWVTSSLSSSTIFWSTKNAGGPPYQAFSLWTPASCSVFSTCYSPSAQIVGFNMGIGSGWSGVFSGGVADVSWTIDGVVTASSFFVLSLVPSE
jgi:hypothetical protein